MIAAILVSSAALADTSPWTQDMILNYVKKRTVEGIKPEQITRQMLGHLETDGFSAFPVQSFTLELARLKVPEVAQYIRSRFSYKMQILVQDFDGDVQRVVTGGLEKSLGDRILARKFNDPQSWKLGPDMTSLPNFTVQLEAEYAETPGAIWEVVHGKVTREGRVCTVTINVLGKVNTYRSIPKKWQVSQSKLLPSPVEFQYPYKGRPDFSRMADAVLDGLNRSFGIHPG